MANLIRKSIEPAIGGLDTDSSPQSMRRGFAPVHENFLTDRSGVLAMRGPVVRDVPNAGGPPRALHITDPLSPDPNPQIVAGIWSYDENYLVSTVVKDTDTKVDPWTTPYDRAFFATDLSIAGTQWMLFRNPETGVTSVQSTILSGDPKLIGGRGVRLGDSVYGYGYNNSTATGPTLDFFYSRKFLRWDGTTADDITEYFNAPIGALDVIGHLNRIWTLGGTPDLGVEPVLDHDLNSLFFSDLGGPTADTEDVWRDDISGLVNRIVVESEDKSDFGVALAKVGQNLVIFKRRSVHVLYGYSPSTFTLRTVSHTIGCLDQRSVVEAEGGVYFMSQEGYMFFDGSEFQNLTAPGLRHGINRVAQQTVGDNQQHDSLGGRCYAIEMPNNYIMMSMLKQDPATGIGISGVPSFSGLLHTETGAWTRFQSHATFSPIPVALAEGNSGDPILIDGEQLLVARHLTDPESGQPALPFEEVVRVDSALGTVQAGIPSKVWTRVLILESPAELSHLHRILIDYMFQIVGSVDDQNDGWFVNARLGDGTMLFSPSYRLPNMGDTSSYPYQRRHVQDIFHDARDIQLQIEWVQVGPDPFNLERAEIHGITVEYERGRQTQSA